MTPTAKANIKTITIFVGIVFVVHLSYQLWSAVGIFTQDAPILLKVLKSTGLSIISVLYILLVVTVYQECLQWVKG